MESARYLNVEWMVIHSTKDMIIRIDLEAYFNGLTGMKTSLVTHQQLLLKVSKELQDWLMKLIMSNKLGGGINKDKLFSHVG